MRKLFAIALLMGLGGAARSIWPDVSRYLKMRAM